MASESFSLWKVTSAYLHQIAWEIMKQTAKFLLILRIEPIVGR